MALLVGSRLDVVSEAQNSNVFFCTPGWGKTARWSHLSCCVVFFFSFFFWFWSLFAQSNCQKQRASPASLLRLWQLLTIRIAIGSKLLLFFLGGLFLVRPCECTCQESVERLEGGAGAGRHSWRGYTSSLLLLECGSESREPNQNTAWLVSCVFVFYGCRVSTLHQICTKKPKNKKIPKWSTTPLGTFGLANAD